MERQAHLIMRRIRELELCPNIKVRVEEGKGVGEREREKERIR